MIYFFIQFFTFLLDLMEKKYDILNEKALMREKKTQKYDCISQIPVYIYFGKKS